jgi:anti-anti-sigma factor
MRPRALLRCLEEALERNARVVVDLTNTRLLDCACMGALTRARRRADAEGRTIVLAGPRPAVRTALRATQLDTVFPVQPDRLQEEPRPAAPHCGPAALGAVGHGVTRRR